MFFVLVLYESWFCHGLFTCCIFAQTLPMCSSGGSAFQFGATEKQAGLEMPRCFLSSSPENTLSVQTSPVASSLTNGPLNKVGKIPLSTCYASAQRFSVVSSCVVLVPFSGLACLHPAISSIQSYPQEPRATSLRGRR